MIDIFDNEPSTSDEDMTAKQLYNIWCGMRQRCNNKNATGYEYYGGNGVTICNEWNMFSRFQVWAMKEGYRRGLSIERINPFGNYCAENCTWINRLDQAKNKRKETQKIELDGEMLSFNDLARISGINRKVIYSRINILGWTAKDAISMPVNSAPDIKNLPNTFGR